MSSRSSFHVLTQWNQSRANSRLLAYGAKFEVAPRYIFGTYRNLHESDSDLERRLAVQVASLERHGHTDLGPAGLQFSAGLWPGFLSRWFPGIHSMVSEWRDLPLCLYAGQCHRGLCLQASGWESHHWQCGLARGLWWEAALLIVMGPLCSERPWAC